VHFFVSLLQTINKNQKALTWKTDLAKAFSSAMMGTMKIRSSTYSQAMLFG
jgi:hypothetical protein